MPSERAERMKSTSSSRNQDHKKNSRRDKDVHSSSNNSRHRQSHRHHQHERSDRNFDRKRRSGSSEQQDHRKRKAVVKEEPPDDYERHERERTNRKSHSSAARSHDDQYRWGKPSTSTETEAKPQDKEQPNFQLSGKLTEDTNTYNGVVIKYNEPPEARKPRRRWRLYPFKADQSLPHIPIHRQSAYLIGRMRLVADLPIDHPSCSKQHAVLQFRLVNYEHEDGTIRKRIRPYIIDLDSSNGTYVNNQRVEPRRYVELFEKDVLKFGYSTREYVLLHEDCKEESDDDNVVEEEATTDS